MANQNNAMTNLTLQSNINLNRYKEGIQPQISLNGCNMPVIGGKYTPMKTEYVTDKEFIYEDGDEVYPYDGDSSFSYYRDRLDIINNSGAEIVGLSRNSRDDIEGFYTINISGGNVMSLYFNKFDAHNEVTQILMPETISVPDKKYEYTKVYSLNGDYKTDYIVIKFTSDLPYMIAYDKVNNTVTWLRHDYICRMVVTDDVDPTGSYSTLQVMFTTGEMPIGIYTPSPIAITGSYGSYDYVELNTEKMYNVALGDMNNPIFFPMNGRIFCMDTGTSGEDGKIYEVSLHKNSSNEYYLYAKYYSSSDYDDILYKLYHGWDAEKPCNNHVLNTERNGAYVTHSFIFGHLPDGKENKLENYDYFREFTGIEGNVLLAGDSSFGYGSMYNFTGISIENNIPKNNKIIVGNGGMFQGCNLLYADNLSYDSIDPIHYSNFGAFKLKNGKWWYKDRHGENLVVGTPKVVDGKIYFGGSGGYRVYNPKTKMTDTINALYGVYMRFEEQRIDGHFVFKGYDGVKDWTDKAKYAVISRQGENDIVTLNAIQFAPILVCDAIRSAYTFVESDDETDTTLYNSLGWRYTPPTDGDFYIPLMGADVIEGSLLNDIIVRRIDGSTAKLIKFNNKYYPSYYLSSISENIEYTFVVQGQVYNVANGVICDTEGTGIADVSDQKYIGSNGIIALFYNQRSKKIYQFGASNILEEVMNCDEIKEVEQADLSNTNDECYVLYKTFEGISKLICIESDGQCYEVASDKNIVKFQVGNKGVFVWTNQSADGSHVYTVNLYRIMAADDDTANLNNYIETGFFGTDEFKLMTVDRVFLRFTPVNPSAPVNPIAVTLNCLTFDGIKSEQHIIEHPNDIYCRLSPFNKKCMGISVRLDNLNNYTLSAMSIGVTDDSVMVNHNDVDNVVYEEKPFDESTDESFAQSDIFD